MKLIDQGLAITPKPKRKPAQRKLTDGTTSHKKSVEDGESSTTGPSSKRRRVSQAKAAPTVTQIQCITCNQTDVPLILGGRKLVPFDVCESSLTVV
jgi:hypothetical protein